MRGFLTAQEIKILEEAHLAAQQKRQADRIKTILLLNEGYEYATISHILRLDDSTIRRYYQEYQKGGIDELLEDHYHGSEAFLTPTQRQQLEVYLDEQVRPNASAVCAYVKEEWKIVYSIEGMTHLLHLLGFSYKKTRHIPGKADATKQEVFVKQYEELKRTKKPEDRIYFVDASHPHHNSMPAYGWIRRGETKDIRSNTGRARLNLNGAFNLEDLKVIVREDETINATSMIALIKQLEGAQPEGLIYLILDNARYNRSKMVNAYVKRHRRVKLLFLPPYAPNLNLIERLWKFFHEKKLYNHYYDTFLEFKTACLDFFDGIDQYREEIKIRLADNFQIIGT